MEITAARDLAKSDTANDRFSWIMVTVAQGSVVLLQEGGNTTTLAEVPIGVWIPVGTALAVTTASTADGLMVS